MSNNLPSKVQQGFFIKIRRFFAELFNKKNNDFEQAKGTTVKNIANTKVIPENVFTQMKKESKKLHLEDDILNMVNNNSGLIETLSIEQVEYLNKLYDKVIEEKKMKIKRLEKMLAKA